MAHGAKRNQALDILRGIAILLVIGVHYDYFHLWAQIGWTGVDLFFVLSGFLISGLLFNEFKHRGNIDVVRFWVRRGFKIYPAFYIFIFVTSIPLALTHKLNMSRLWPELLFLQSYLPHIWIHTWSLSVEEHFYFLLPILLLLLIHRSSSKVDPFRLIPWIFGVFAIGGLFLRYLALTQGATSHWFYRGSLLRMDSLFAGVLLSYWSRYRPGIFKLFTSRFVGVIGFVCILPAAFCNSDGLFMGTLGFALLYIGYGCILSSCVYLPYSRNFVARLLAWIGKYSYSIYLWHVAILLKLYAGHMSLTLLLVGGTASILFGAGMSKVIEIPSLKIRDRLFPSFTKQDNQLKLEAERPGASVALRGELRTSS